MPQKIAMPCMQAREIEPVGDGGVEELAQDHHHEGEHGNREQKQAADLFDGADGAVEHDR